MMSGPIGFYKLHVARKGHCRESCAGLVAMAVALALSAFLVRPTHAAGETAPKLRTGKFTLTEADRAYWAFQPVHRPSVPPNTWPGQARNENTSSIDRFVAATLAEHRLTPNPQATPRQLVRRLSFDLIGLPPSPEMVAAFERNPTDQAWEKLVDQFLASPQYGERWGRHWLDLVRYAESNGYERDGAKPDAWRYRDYVIDSFNRDKPYDQFIREQLAGDEMADETMAQASTATKEWRDAIVATGFYRLHIWDDEPDSTVKAEFDDLDDIMVATGTAFLGLTIGCARCHDHKFDPISQADYYSMLSFVRSIEPYGQQHTGGGGRGTGRIQRTLATAAETSAWETGRQQRVEAARKALAAATNDATRKTLEAALKQQVEARAPFEQALAITENGPTAKATFVLSRGDAFSPKEEVSPSFPTVFGLPAPKFPERPAGAKTTGRRRVLAEWIASPKNPLTARVMANRIWQHHFGTGLVPTPDDFGRTGLLPTHPALLDYLASEFVDNGWSMKRLHKQIVMSRTYRMSSRADHRAALAVDEGNTFLWRQNLRRLESEVVRDTMLAVSGALNPKAGGASVYPTLPKEVHGTQDSSGKGWADSSAEEQNRRSVYLVVKRALKVPLLECLDFANSTSPTGARPITTTAPQALMLLNDSFVQRQAAQFVERLQREAGSNAEARIERGFLLAVQRRPSRAEIRASRDLIAAQERQAAEDKIARPDVVAWQSFARGLLNLNEVVYAD